MGKLLMIWEYQCNLELFSEWKLVLIWTKIFQWNCFLSDWFWKSQPCQMFGCQNSRHPNAMFSYYHFSMQNIETYFYRNPGTLFYCFKSHKEMTVNPLTGWFFNGHGLLAEIFLLFFVWNQEAAYYSNRVKKLNFHDNSQARLMLVVWRQDMQY